MGRVARFRRPIVRRHKRILTPGAAVAAVPQTGVSVAAAVGTSLPRRVATQSGVCAAAFAGVGAAAKKTAAAGRVTAAVDGGAVHSAATEFTLRRVTVVTRVGRRGGTTIVVSSAPVGGGAPEPVIPQSGAASAVPVGVAAVKRVAVQSGTAVTAPAALGSSVRVAAARGATASALASAGSSSRALPQTGRVTAAFSAVSGSAKRATPAAAAGYAPAPTAASEHVAEQAGDLRVFTAVAALASKTVTVADAPSDASALLTGAAMHAVNVAPAFTAVPRVYVVSRAGRRGGTTLVFSNAAGGEPIVPQVSAQGGRCSVALVAYRHVPVPVQATPLVVNTAALQAAQTRRAALPTTVLDFGAPATQQAQQQLGAAAAFPAGTSVVGKKVAGQGGTAAALFATRRAQVPVRAQAGPVPLYADGAAINEKLSSPAATAAAVVAGTGRSAKVVAQAGRGFAAFVGTRSGIAARAQGGSCALVAAVAGAQSKRTAQAGRVAASFVGTQSGTPQRAQSGTTSFTTAGLGAHSRRSTATGATTVSVVGVGAHRRIAAGRGATTAAMAGAAAAARITPQSGRVCALITGTRSGVASRPQAGSSALCAAPRGTQSRRSTGQVGDCNLAPTGRSLQGKRSTGAAGRLCALSVSVGGAGKRYALFGRLHVAFSGGSTPAKYTALVPRPPSWFVPRPDDDGPYVSRPVSALVPR